MRDKRCKQMLVLIGIALSVLLSSCRVHGRGELFITDIEIFKDTPAWELALAVLKQNVKSIKKIVENEPSLLNYQEPHFGATLLLWSVGMEKYNSAKTLLELGADPNIASTYDGTTPLFLASGFSWVDPAWFSNEDPKYVKLLLQYGADPNIPYKGHNKPDVGDLIESGTSPLMHSIPASLEKTKALVEGGADIDYKTPSGTTAAIVALNFAVPQYAYYLIVECKAKVNEPYYSWLASYFPNASKSALYPVNLLRHWIFTLGSKKHMLKMQIVEEFKRQGVDYWSTEIPESRLDQIKKLYPDTWEEYIQKY